MINQVTFGGTVTKLFPGDKVSMFSLVQTTSYTYNGEEKEKKMFLDVRCTNSTFQKLQPNQEVLVVGRLDTYKGTNDQWKTIVFASDVFAKNPQAVITKVSLEQDDESEDVPF